MGDRSHHPNMHQDVSKANITRPGLDGYQTSLCSHLFRLLKSTRVPWVIFENVGGLLHWHRDGDNERPPAIAYVCEELEKLGYSWAHRVVNLQGFGIPQRRNRVFIVASIYADPRDILLSMESDCQGQCQDMFNRECYNCYGGNPHQIVSCLCPGESRLGPIMNEAFTLTTGNVANMCIIKNIADDTGVISGMTIEDAEKLMGLPRGWTNPPGTDIPSTVRSKIIGLAVAVPQSEWLGHRLAKPHDMKFLRSEQGCPFNAKNQGEDGSAWPKAAWNILSPSTNNAWQSRRYLEINDTPTIKPFYPLGDFGLEANGIVPVSRIQTYLDKLDTSAKSNLQTYELNAINTQLVENNYNFESDTEIENNMSSPKKRGRPPMTPSSTIPKKRGRPPTTPSSTIPKKRGRPPTTPSSTIPKKRGRPPKEATGVKLMIDNSMTYRSDTSQQQCSTNSSLTNTQMTLHVSSNCGVCKICETNKKMFKPQSLRQKRKCSESAYENKALQPCPQGVIISKAHVGNKGAQLTLRREKAIGTKIRIYWPCDRKHYPVTLVHFNPSNHRFTLEHDEDGRIETVKLWEETIS